MKVWKTFAIFLIFTLSVFIIWFGEKAERENVTENLNKSIKIKIKRELNLSVLTNKDIIEYAMKNKEFRDHYEGWDFKIVGKKLVEKVGEELLSVDMYAGRDNWSTINHVWFNLNKKGEVEDLGIYEWVKPFSPEAVSDEEKERILSIALNDSRVKKTIDGREFRADVNKLVNFVTGEDTGIREVLIQINNSMEAYYVVIIDGRVESIKQTR